MINQTPLQERKLVDNFGRKIDYLRISVTDRCNLRCVYCMPETGIAAKPHAEILSFEEIYTIVNIAAGLGIHKVRITGGEPLVRKDLVSLIGKLRPIKNLKEICLTTNGIYLSENACSLKHAGLDRINISLDSLNSERFKKITRGGDLEEVFKGIETALSAGFSSLKINVVLMKGVNDGEIVDFINLAKRRPLHIRFIEHMPTSLDFSDTNLFLSCQKAKYILSSMSGKGNFTGTIGFISPISEPFCNSCNKLRLTADGWLRSCLHSSRGVNLKNAIRKGADKDTLARLIKEAVCLKPESHNLTKAPADIQSENFSMCQIGG